MSSGLRLLTATGDVSQAADLTADDEHTSTGNANGKNGHGSNGHANGTNGATQTAPAPGPRSGALPTCLLYTSPSPRDGLLSRMPSSA